MRLEPRRRLVITNNLLLQPLLVVVRPLAQRQLVDQHFSVVQALDATQRLIRSGLLEDDVALEASVGGS